jgi:hypothetical protein
MSLMNSLECPVLPLRSPFIVDTGLTDNLPGEVHKRPWVDFAHNQSEAQRIISRSKHSHHQMLPHPINH